MFNKSGLILDKIVSMEMWSPVPVYQKLDVGYYIKICLGCLIGDTESAKELKYYLKNREENNKKYKEFWEDTSNIKFNKNKTQYLVMKL